MIVCNLMLYFLVSLSVDSSVMLVNAGIRSLGKLVLARLEVSGEL